MTEHTHHTELIDAYLSGSMSQGEQDAFLDLIETDPVLKEEFLFQESIVSGLKEYRKSELKNRLSSITVGVGLFGLLMNASYQQVMAAALTFGIIGYGAFYAVTEWALPDETSGSEITIDSPIDLTVDHPQYTQYQLTDKEQLKSIIATVMDRQVAETAIAPAVSSPAKASRIQNSFSNSEKRSRVAEDNSITKTEQVSTPSKATTPDFMLPSVDDVPREEDAMEMAAVNESAAEYQGIEENVEGRKVEVEQVRKDGKIRQYRFEQGKLYLYGDFAGEPYELLEINTKGIRKLFFYHAQEYYRLNQFQKSITKFDPITDRKLLKELEILRTKRN